MNSRGFTKNEEEGSEKGSTCQLPLRYCWLHPLHRNLPWAVNRISLSAKKKKVWSRAGRAGPRGSVVKSQDFQEAHQGHVKAQLSPTSYVCICHKLYRLWYLLLSRICVVSSSFSKDVKRGGKSDSSPARFRTVMWTDDSRYSVSTPRSKIW